jgi:hypothetical protein
MEAMYRLGCAVHNTMRFISCFEDSVFYKMRMPNFDASSVTSYAKSLILTETSFLQFFFLCIDASKVLARATKVEMSAFKHNTSSAFISVSEAATSAV